MSRRTRIPLHLTGFGLELLEARAERSGVSLARFVERGAERYLAESDRDVPSRPVPRFLRESGRPVSRQSVEVELDPELVIALEQEADAEGVALDLIVAHAAMLLAAELDT